MSDDSEVSYEENSNSNKKKSVSKTVKAKSDEGKKLLSKKHIKSNSKTHQQTKSKVKREPMEESSSTPYSVSDDYSSSSKSEVIKKNVSSRRVLSKNLETGINSIIKTKLDENEDNNVKQLKKSTQVSRKYIVDDEEEEEEMHIEVINQVKTESKPTISDKKTNGPNNINKPTNKNDVKTYPKEKEEINQIPSTFFNKNDSEKNNTFLKMLEINSKSLEQKMTNEQDISKLTLKERLALKASQGRIDEYFKAMENFSSSNILKSNPYAREISTEEVINDLLQNGKKSIDKK